MQRSALIAVILALAALLALAGPTMAAHPRLSYVKAKRSIQTKADRFAHASTKITSMYRLGDLTWSSRAEWKRVNPTGCSGCGYDPATGSFYDTPTTEDCSVALRATQLRSGRVRVSTEDFACY